jgi:hypothetical protein
LNAVVDEELHPRRQIHGHDRSWLESSLNDWGHWIEEHSDYEGYPRSDAIAAWLDGAGGGGQRGHRVLCLDMPHRIYAMHVRVILLPEHEREAVWVQYVPQVKKETGQVWTRAEKCLRLGLNEEAFKKRLTRAKLRILGIEPD